MLHFILSMFFFIEIDYKKNISYSSSLEVWRSCKNIDSRKQSAFTETFIALLSTKEQLRKETYNCFVTPSTDVACSKERTVYHKKSRTKTTYRLHRRLLRRWHQVSWWLPPASYVTPPGYTALFSSDSSFLTQTLGVHPFGLTTLQGTTTTR